MQEVVESSGQRRHVWRRSFQLRAAMALPLALAVLPLGGCLAARHGLAKLERKPREQELTVELPPVDLPAYSTHHSAPQPEPFWVTVPVDGWLHGFSLEMVDDGGNILPLHLLHHVKLMTPGQRELFAPIMMRLVGGGSETRAGYIPHYLGYPLQAGDSLLATAMLHNPDGRDYDGVRVRVHLRYTPMVEAGSVVLVVPFFMHVTPPDAHSGYDLPPGRSERSWQARPAVKGRVLALGGHIHRYGTELRLEHAASGKVLWRGKVRTDSAGHVLSVQRNVYRWSRGVRLDPAEVYRVTAVYDNPTGDTLRDAGMGTVAGIFRPAGAWPAVSRSDSLYARDRARELGASHGRGPHVHH